MLEALKTDVLFAKAKVCRVCHCNACVAKCAHSNGDSRRAQVGTLLGGNMIMGDHLRMARPGTRGRRCDICQGLSGGSSGGYDLRHDIRFDESYHGYYLHLSQSKANPVG